MSSSLNDSICEELVDCYHKYKDENENKKQIIMNLILKGDTLSLIKTLFDRREECIIKYFFLNFAFEDKDIYFISFWESIRTNSIETVQFFINNNLIDLEDMRDEDENTPLMLSVIYGHLLLSKIFLSFYPDFIHISNKHNYLPLTISVFNSDLLLFHLLLANYHEPINNLTELMIIAIHNECLEIVQQLIQSHFHNVWDNILMHHASCQNNIEIFNLVSKLNWLEDPSQYKVADAVMNKFNYIVFQDENGEIPLHWSVMRGDIRIVKSLVETMSNCGVSVDFKSKSGLTPFHLACLKQDKEVVHLLYDNGANVNETDNEGNSIIHLLAAIGDKDWLDYIINKFNVNCFLKNQKGNTPLVLAILSDREAVVEYFLQFIPNVNWRNKLGQTCLHAAVFTNNYRIVYNVLLRKPKVEIEDVTGLTAYHYAKMENNTEILNLIYSYLESQKPE